MGSGSAAATNAFSADAVMADPDFSTLESDDTAPRPMAPVGMGGLAAPPPPETVTGADVTPSAPMPETAVGPDIGEPISTLPDRGDARGWLKAAGFSNDEIASALTDVRSKMRGAGYAPQDIAKTIGVPGPGEPEFDAHKWARSDTGMALASEAWDEYAMNGTPMGQVLNAFGAGHQSAWGSTTLTPVTDEVSNWLKGNSGSGEYQKGRDALAKTFNESFLRPAAMGIEMAMREFFVAMPSAIENAAQHGGELGEALFGPLAAGMEAFPEGGSFMHIGPGAVVDTLASRMAARADAGEAALRALNPAIPHYIAKAHDLGIIQDTPLPTSVPGVTGFPDMMLPRDGDVPPRLAATAARQRDPELFREYDTLQAQKQTYEGFLKDQTADVDARIANEEKQYDNPAAERLALSERIDALHEERAKILSGDDNPDVATANKSLEDINSRLDELSPNVRAAYEEAGRTSAGNTPETVPAEVGFEPTSVVEPTAVEGQIANIAEDTARKVALAGRPQEEADLIGILQGARYRARAANLTGTTPEELYAAQAPGWGGEWMGTGRARNALGSYSPEANVITLYRRLANSSTAIHELGHRYLEEIMADAADARATPQVQADAAAVRQWLAAEEGAALTRRQHEKFARGFERYLMEGTSPSRELDGVFARFKQWMTGIYQKLAALRAPLTPEIRKVYDRLLASGEEKSVVVPEKEGLGERHARIEETTAQPTLADANRLREEADNLARQQAPEVHDELRRSGAGDSGNPPENSEPDRNVPAPGPVAGEVGPVGEPARVGAGGTENAPEGVGADTAVAERPGAEPAAKSDTQSLARSPSPYPDADPFGVRAGNIRLELLGTPRGMDDFFRWVADKNNDFLDQRRGRLSDAEVLALSDDFGVNPAFMDRDQLGQAFNAEQIMWLRMAARKSAADIFEKSTAAMGGDEASVVALAKAVARHEVLQAKLSQAAAEWGRAGRSFRALDQMGEGEGALPIEALNAFLKENTGRDFYQMQEMAEYFQKLKTPGRVGQLINQTRFGKFQDAMYFYYVNSLLSGPITHLRYAFGNFVNAALIDPFVTTPLQATYGAVRSVFSNAPQDRVYFSEIAADLYGWYRGSIDGISAAGEAFKTGYSATPGGTGAAAGFSPFGSGTISPPILGKYAGFALGLPSRSVSAIHSLGITVRYTQEIAKLAVRAAKEEGLSITDPAFWTKVGDLKQNPTQAMMDVAVPRAFKEMYMSPLDYNSFLGKMTRLADHNIVTRALYPFIKVGALIDRGAVEYSPFALALPRVQSEIYRGGATADQAMGRLSTGIAIASATSWMVLSGLATGDGPADPAENEEWRKTHEPNHITIGPFSINYQGLGQFGIQMRLIANLTENLAGMDTKDHEVHAVNILEGVLKATLDDTFLRTTKDMVNAVFHFPEYGASYLKNFATGFIPYSAFGRQVAREIDPYQRQPDRGVAGIGQQAETVVPGLSRNVRPRYDSFGQPVPAFTGSPIAIGAGQRQRYANDPAVNELDRLGMHPGAIPREVRGVALTPDQHEYLERVGGQELKRQLDFVVGLKAYQSAPTHIQMEMLKNAMEAGHRLGEASLLAQPENWRILYTANKVMEDVQRGHPPSGGYPLNEKVTPEEARREYPYLVPATIH